MLILFFYPLAAVTLKISPIVELIKEYLILTVTYIS